MRSFKNRLRGLIELLPYGVDLRLWLGRKRLGITYRGVFESHSEAMGSVSSSNNQYDLINREKALHEKEERQSLDRPIPDFDYPLLFWLSRLLKPAGSVLDLGGSVGHFFYRSQQYFQHPPGIRWTIAELPAAVELGRRFAVEQKASGLSFFDSAQSPPWPTADILMTAGTLQYMEDSIEDVLAGFESKPAHILVNSLPMHPIYDFWTLQDLGACEVPYHIVSESVWLAGMERHGYRLVDRWTQPRKIQIPFYEKNSTESYTGFVFERLALADSVAALTR